MKGAWFRMRERRSIGLSAVLCAALVASLCFPQMGMIRAGETSAESTEAEQAAANLTEKEQSALDYLTKKMMEHADQEFPADPPRSARTAATCWRIIPGQ